MPKQHCQDVPKELFMISYQLHCLCKRVPIEDFVSYQFHCPAEDLDAIYGSHRFPMGS
jgi:hypothetical protein